ncbi:transporter substrate-binding domain-containing protein [Chloroflexota bacterium]
MKATYRNLSIVCGLVLALVLLLGCSESEQAAPEEADTGQETSEEVSVPVEGSVLDEIRERGVIRMAVFLRSGSPLERATEGGEPEGYLIDVGYLLAKDLGVEPEFIDLEWQGIIPSLLSGKVDIILAAISATPERALVIDFPGAIVFYDVTVLVHKDGRIKSLEDLAQPGVTISVAAGSTQHFYAMQNFPDAEILASEGATEARLEVASKRSDASLTDSHATIKFAQENPNTIPLRDEAAKIVVVSREPGSMSIRQGDTRFFRWLQTWQDWYWHQGIFEAMYQKWMGPIFEGESTE